MAKLGLPTRNEIRDEDFELGGPGWVEEFGQGTGYTRDAAVHLQGQGNRLNEQATAAQGRATPQTNFNSASMSLGRAGARGQAQTGAADWLSDFARGPQGPSAAQAQLQQGANQAMSQSLALARSGSGFGESANTLADAQRANADIMAGASNQAAQLRAQEDQAFRAQQLQAMGGAADIYGAARGADLATAGQEADMSQFRTQAELEAQQMRDAMQLGLSGQGIEATNLGIQGSLAAQGLGLDAQRAALEGEIAQGQLEGQRFGTETELFGIRERRDRELAEQRRRNRGEAAGLIGSAAGAAASLLSDERSKTKARSTELRSRYEALRD